MKTLMQEIRQGEIVTSKIMAKRLGITRQMAAIGLRRKANGGQLNRAAGGSGWIYARPETMPRLLGEELSK